MIKIWTDTPTMPETAHPVYEQLVIAAANKTMVGGSVAAAAGGAAVKVSWVAEHGAEIATMCSVGGLLIAAIGLVISIVFQCKRDKREQLNSLRNRRCGVRGTKADRRS